MKAKGERAVRCSAWLGGIDGCFSITYMDENNAVALIHGKEAVAKLRRSINRNRPATEVVKAEAPEPLEPPASDNGQRSAHRARKPTQNRAAQGKRQP